MTKVTDELAESNRVHGGVARVRGNRPWALGTCLPVLLRYRMQQHLRFLVRAGAFFLSTNSNSRAFLNRDKQIK